MKLDRVSSLWTRFEQIRDLCVSIYLVSPKIWAPSPYFAKILCEPPRKFIFQRLMNRFLDFGVPQCTHREKFTLETHRNRIFEILATITILGHPPSFQIILQVKIYKNWRFWWCFGVVLAILEYRLLPKPWFWAIFHQNLQKNHQKIKNLQNPAITPQTTAIWPCIPVLHMLPRV